MLKAKVISYITFGLVIFFATTPVSRGETVNSLGISCHLVPRRLCWLSFQITSTPSILSKIPAGGLKIILEESNIGIPAGKYQGAITIYKNKSKLISLPTRIIVDGEVVKLIPESSFRLTNHLLQSRQDIRIKFHSNDLPMMIFNLDKKLGHIREKLLIDGERVAMSASYTTPAKGCWLNEQQCQPD